MQQVFPRRRDCHFGNPSKYEAKEWGIPLEFIKRFKNISLDCHDHFEEKTLVEMCIGNMIMEY